MPERPMHILSETSDQVFLQNHNIQNVFLHSHVNTDGHQIYPLLSERLYNSRDINLLHKCEQVSEAIGIRDSDHSHQ